jgi:nitrate reductase cytochrome c-type subunit
MTCWSFATSTVTVLIEGSNTSPSRRNIGRENSSPPCLCQWKVLRMKPAHTAVSHSKIAVERATSASSLETAQAAVTRGRQSAGSKSHQTAKDRMFATKRPLVPHQALMYLVQHNSLGIIRSNKPMAESNTNRRLRIGRLQRD